MLIKIRRTVLDTHHSSMGCLLWTNRLDDGAENVLALHLENPPELSPLPTTSGLTIVSWRPVLLIRNCWRRNLLPPLYGLVFPVSSRGLLYVHPRGHGVRSLCDGLWVDPLSYISCQPVLHDWCNKGHVMCILSVGWRI